MGLSKDDWVRAALFAIAEGGAGAVAVEPLAAQLGATKGSFYWHFRNREQLVAEALEFWERDGTDDVIAELAPVSDPFERLRRLLEIAIGYEEDDAAGQADVGLLAAANDPVVGPVLRRVADKRLDFLERIFRDIGFTARESRQRARIGYSAFLGWFELRRVAPHRTPLGRERAAYERAVLELLLEGAPAEER
ncbi:MAG TPA: helix-turn-helix domain-containing protein [Thermoleophilaceae bacterium]|nr:helix-turn-helix domain-containing protein [Thermoleophilaceae bacterium]